MATMRPERDEIDTWVRVGEATSVLLPSDWHSLASSRIADGRDALFLDHMTESAAVLDCPNMSTDLQAFLKLHIDRHPAIATDNWLYLNDLTITTQDM